MTKEQKVRCLRHYFFIMDLIKKTVKKFTVENRWCPKGEQKFYFKNEHEQNLQEIYDYLFFGTNDLIEFHSPNMMLFIYEMVKEYYNNIKPKLEY